MIIYHLSTYLPIKWIQLQKFILESLYVILGNVDLKSSSKPGISLASLYKRDNASICRPSPSMFSVLLSELAFRGLGNAYNITTILDFRSAILHLPPLVFKENEMEKFSNL